MKVTPIGVAVLMALVVVPGCGSTADKKTKAHRKANSLPAKEISIFVYSGKELPPPETWTAKVGQRVVFDVDGLATKIGIVGPGLGNKFDSSFGLTSVGFQDRADFLEFTPSKRGEYRVSQVESGLFLGTLRVD
jgi:hypothetical protein